MKKNVLLALILFFSCRILAQTSVEQNAYFNATNQGWYKSGIPSYGKKDYLLGATARTFTEFGAGDGDFLRFEAKMGFDFDLFYDVLSQPDGRVDVNFPIKVKFDYPTDRTYGCGQEVPITTSYTPLPGYSINSQPPQFKMNVGVRAKAGAYAEVESFFGDGEIFDIGSSSFEDANSSNYEDLMLGGEYPFLGFDTQNGVYTPFHHGLPYTIPDDVTHETQLSGVIDNPFTPDPSDVISGTTISETANKQFMNIEFDPIQFVGDAIGVPLSQSGSNFFGSAGYSIFEAPLNFTSSLTQSLEFNPTVNIRMQLDRTYDYRVRDKNNNIVQTGTGNDVTIEAGETLLVKVPDDDQPISVTPSYMVDNDFTTHIRYDAGVDVIIRALSAYAQTNSWEICDPTGILDALGAPDCVSFGPYGESFGPVYEHTFNVYDFGFDFYPPTTRKLGGFQASLPGQPFTLRPDNVPPLLTTKNITVYIPDAGGPVGITPQDVTQSASDANGGGIRYLSATPNSFECANLGANTVQVTIDDSRCNATTRPATVTVVDRTKPTINCKPVTAYLNDFGATSITTNDVFQSGWDNCGIVNHVSVLPNSFVCNNLGANLVTLTVNDGHGNSNTCSSTVTVADNKPPVLVCQPKTVFLNDLGQGSIVVADVLQSSYDNCGVVNVTSLSRTSFNCSDLGANTVTVFTNDGHGNNATCDATVTVTDKISPTVACKGKVLTYINTSGIASIVTGDIFLSGWDNCGIVNQQSVLPNTFNCNQMGENIVVLTVNDGHGNTGTCSTNVVVTDIIKPTAICRDVTLNLDNTGQANLNAFQVNNGSYDNCSVASTTLSQTLFNCAHLGTNVVTMTVSDPSNNQSQCTATITVRDLRAPVAKCKNITANLAANGTLSLPAVSVDNVSTDNCSFTLAVTPNTFNCSNVGANTVTLRATDVSGNYATCTAIVTVKDATAPTAVCKNATVVLNDLGQGSLNINQVNNGSSDACGISSLSLSKTLFNCSEIPGGTQSVTLTVNDVHGNIGTCLSNVTVKDNFAPTAVCHNTTVQLGANGTATVYPADLADDSYDNCSVTTYLPAAKVYTSANLGNNNLTITVKDWSGNSATCVSVVTVQPYNGAGGDANNRDAIAETPAGATITLFPNPSDGETNLQFDLEEEADCFIRVYDASGRLVFQRESRGLKGENILPITMKGVAPGIYTLIFQSGNTKVSKRLVIGQ